MDAQSAELLLYAITAIGASVWLVALQFLIRSFPSVAARAADQPLNVEERPPANWICGGAEVEGQPAQLIDKAIVALLTEKPFGGVGPVKILERSDNRIVFEGVSDSSRNHPARIRHAEIRFTPTHQDRTRIAYAAQLSDAPWLLWLGLAFQGLSLVALVAGFGLIRILVIPDPDPAVRWQTVQMLQVANVLWPTFLFAGLYRRGRRVVRDGLDLMVYNLPYHDAR